LTAKAGGGYAHAHHFFYHLHELRQITVELVDFLLPLPL
jgi:hypothetical protein